MPSQADSIAQNCCYFAGNYDRGNESVILELERLTIGSDYGGTSWATREQIDEIINNLALTASSHLLDIGAGCGWPALYLSEKTGCQVTLVDLPLVAIKQAAQRAQTDNIQSRAHCVQGSGASLPIADQSYDRLNHSDVLCCMPEKRELLEECRRVASDSAVMHFSVILPASGLSSRDYKRVLDIGPPHIDTPDGYDKILVETGWRIRTFVDVTDEFNTRLKALNWGLGTYKNELIKVYGKTEYHDEVSRRKTEQQLASQHLMKRVIYIADAIT